MKRELADVFQVPWAQRPIGDRVLGFPAFSTFCRRIPVRAATVARFAFFCFCFVPE
jgi:hypothetical protein